MLSNRERINSSLYPGACFSNTQKRLDSFFSSERGCVFVTSLFQNSQLRCRTFIREVGFFLRLCFPKESRVRPWGSEVAWVDLGSGKHWPGASFSSWRCNQVHWHLLTQGLVLDPGKGRSRFEPISRARGPQRWLGSSVRTQLTVESQVLGSEGAGRQRGSGGAQWESASSFAQSTEL